MSENEYSNLPLLVAQPWSNGTEWEIWEHNNCSRCVKEPTCDLIGDAFLHGGLTTETAARMGWKDEYDATRRWWCAELDVAQPPPKPAARVMEDAGAVRLPGFDVPAAAERVTGAASS